MIDVCSSLFQENYDSVFASSIALLRFGKFTHACIAFAISTVRTAHENAFLSCFVFVQQRGLSFTNCLNKQPKKQIFEKVFKDQP